MYIDILIVIRSFEKEIKYYEIEIQAIKKNILVSQKDELYLNEF